MYISTDMGNIKQQQAGYQSGGALAASQLQVPDGLSTAIKFLAEEISQSALTAENICSSLGISWPPQDSKVPQDPSGAAGYLRALSSRLRDANEKLGRALEHINS